MHHSEQTCLSFRSDLTDQLEVLKSMQDAVAKELEETSAGLGRAKEARVTFLTEILEIQTWLKKAEDQLEEGVTDLQEGKDRHKALVAEIKEHKPDVEKLKAEAKDLVQQPSSSEEKNEILDSLADVTSQWEAVQEMADEKSEFCSLTCVVRS